MATSVSNNNPEHRLKPKGKHNCRVWETLFEVDKKYIPMKPIGNGAFGVVCSAINKDTNEKVAIKKLSNIFEFEDSDSSIRTLREMKLLRLIRHENVITLKDVVMPVQKTSYKDVYMVYELMDTDLHQIINSSLPISNDHCKYFMFQMLRGLKYLHSANVLHRDLKPANMLVNTSNCDLKICDFGLARTNGVDGEFMTRYVVTRWYRAPELLLSFHNYGSSIDIWSIGCIFAEILDRKPIFPGTSPLDQLEIIVRVLGSPQGDDLEFIEDSKSLKFIESLPFSMGIQFSRLFPHADPLAIDLLQKMLVFDPTKRITVSEALQHPYIADLYDPECNPPAEGPINLELNKNWGEHMVREEMWNEMLHYHPEAVSAKCGDDTKTTT